MSIAIVTGATGLVGGEAVRLFHAEGMKVLGIDNDMRGRFFAGIASADPIRQHLEASLPRYTHIDADIRDEGAIEKIFAQYGREITLIIHAAAQPSHDWAADHPLVDFSVNALGTVLLLNAMRRHCPEAVFIHCSTNKVYGSHPNDLPLVEQETRWEIDATHPWFEHGIPESMSIDATKHSVFGASKVAADIMVQEFGLYFGLRTAVFRAGCITGGTHRGAVQHGFLAYLAECVATGKPYQVIGHKGKQVRDNIHAHDLVTAFRAFFQAPRSGEIYNIGGGRARSCSVLEAIEGLERCMERKLAWTYVDSARSGDHIWWISDTRKFSEHYPHWRYRYDLDGIFEDFANAPTPGRG